MLRTQVLSRDRGVLQGESDHYFCHHLYLRGDVNLEKKNEMNDYFQLIGGWGSIYFFCVFFLD